MPLPLPQRHCHTTQRSKQAQADLASMSLKPRVLVFSFKNTPYDLCSTSASIAQDPHPYIDATDVDGRTRTRDT